MASISAIFCLDLLLARDRAKRIEADFVVDDPFRVVATGEPVGNLLLVLPYTLLEIARYTGVQHGSALVGSEVDAVNALGHKPDNAARVKPLSERLGIASSHCSSQ
jgi:hypothetical protein